MAAEPSKQPVPQRDNSSVLSPSVTQVFMSTPNATSAIENEDEQQAKLLGTRLPAQNETKSPREKSASETILDYDELARRLKSDIWNVGKFGLEPTKEGQRIMECSYRVNLTHAKLGLFTQYFQVANSLTNGREMYDECEKLQRHISIYSTAVAEYKAFVELSIPSPDLNPPPGDFLDRMNVLDLFMNGYLIETAAFAAAVDEGQLRLEAAGVTRSKVDACPEMKESGAEGDPRIEKLHMARLTRNDMLRDLLKRPGFSLNSDIKELEQFVNRDERIRRERNKFFSRLGMALFGGLALVAPMLIMTLHPTLLTALLTTSLFVLVISIILAIVMVDAETKDIVAATAAYAAVLVVFVGTGGDGDGSGSQSGEGNSASMSKGMIAGIVVGSVAGTLVLGSSLWTAWAIVAQQTERLPYPLLAVTRMNPIHRYDIKQ